MDEVRFEEFARLALVVGTVKSVSECPEIRKPAYRIEVDFGPAFGLKKTVSQVKDLYSVDELLGRQVLGLVNIPAKQVGPAVSEFLLTGFYRDDGSVVLAVPDKPVPDGARLA